MLCLAKEVRHVIQPIGEEIMNIKKLAVEFVTVFVVALVTIVLVTFLWNLIGYGESTIDWETSFSLAIIFGIILSWMKLREIKEK